MNGERYLHCRIWGHLCQRNTSSASQKVLKFWTICGLTLEFNILNPSTCKCVLMPTSFKSLTKPGLETPLSLCHHLVRPWMRIDEAKYYNYWPAKSYFFRYSWSKTHKRLNKLWWRTCERRWWLTRLQQWPLGREGRLDRLEQGGTLGMQASQTLLAACKFFLGQFWEKKEVK